MDRSATYTKAVVYLRVQALLHVLGRHAPPVASYWIDVVIARPQHVLIQKHASRILERPQEFLVVHATVVKVQQVDHGCELVVVRHEPHRFQKLKRKFKTSIHDVYV